MLHREAKKFSIDVHRNFTVASRILSENILNLVGGLNITPLFSSDKHRTKKKIAFQAYAVHLAQFYQTIISELSKEQDKFQITFIVLPHPYFSLRSTLKLKAFAHSKLHVPRENIKFYWETIWDKFDLMVCADVYAKFPLRKTKKYLIKHGSGIPARMLKKQGLHNKTIFDFDLALVAGNYDLELIRTFFNGDKISSKLVPAGVPFLDRLKYPDVTRAAYFKRLSLDMNKKTVLIAPAWSGLQLARKERGDYFRRIVSVLREFDVNIVIKLHAGSLNRVMANFDWHEELGKLSESLNIRTDNDVDDIPALRHSEVLITDISSRAYNFMLLDKPVILYLPADEFRGEWDKKRMEPMEEGAFIARCPSDIKHIFEQLGDQTLMRRERRRVSRECFANYGKATETVVRWIKQGAGL